MDHEARLKLFDAVRVEQGPFLEAVLWRLTGNRELFSEALQESLLLLWRHVEKLQGAPGRTYLFRIAQTAASTAWRKRVGAHVELPEDCSCSCHPPEAASSRIETMARVRRAISELRSDGIPQS